MNASKPLVHGETGPSFEKYYLRLVAHESLSSSLSLVTYLRDKLSQAGDLGDVYGFSTELAVQYNKELRRYFTTRMFQDDSFSLKLKLSHTNTLNERFFEPVFERLEEVNRKAGRGSGSGHETLDELAALTKKLKRIRNYVRGISKVYEIKDQRSALQKVSLAQLALDVMYSLPAEGEDITAHTFLAAPMFTVQTDRLLMSMIFRNLISNAWKYRRRDTTYARIFITCASGPWANFGSLESIVPEPVEGASMVHFVDNGVGIPDVMVERIFEPFHRGVHGKVLDIPDEFNFGEDGDVVGLGVGLTAVRTACQALSIDIRVNSIENVGSIFTLVIPNHLVRNDHHRSDDADFPADS